MIRCVAEVQQKIREDNETFPKRAADWVNKMMETSGDETKAGPQPTPTFKGPAARVEALAACEGSRVFTLR